MRRRCFPFLLLFTTWCVTVLGTANAQDVHEKFWRSYSEIGLRGGDIFESGQGNLFLPVHQTEVSMLFGDIRGNWTDARSSHGNFGVGFRQMLICDWIFGINGFYDIKHSSYGNNFHQGALGLEMLHPNWGVRWNGYLAGEDAKLVPSFNQASLVGNNLFIQQAAERAYSGLDFEIESRLWSHEGPGDEAWGAWMTSYDVELWGAIGVYNYDNDAAGFGEITGPRARIELRILDVPFGGPDSRLVFAGQYEDDDVRGDVSSAMVSLRIPFGRGTRSPRGRLRGLNRRMVAPIMRNTDIISVASLGAPEPAAFASTGQAISQVVTVDPTTVGPEGVIAAAGNDSLVIVDGGASGTILPGGTINVQPGQTVLGGGGRVAVRGLNSGASAVFQASGSRPLIDSAANTTFLAADNSTISSLGITNSGAGQSGVLINGATGARIENVGINVSGASAFGIQANGSSVFTLSDSSINTSGDLGDGVQLLGDSEGVIRGSAIGTSGLNAEGVFAADTSFLSFQQSRIFTSGSGGSEGIQAVGSSQVIVSNSVVTTTGPSTSAIAAAPSGAGDALAIQVSGSTINATGSGVALGGSGFAAGSLDATVFGNLIATPTGEPAIDATTNGVAIMNLSAQGNAIDPIAGTIRLNALGGDLNVTQTAVGIASENALPVTNILIPGGPINFNAPPPIPPSR